MGCLFHKWDCCKCLKCGKIRQVKDYEHKWNGCKCIYCGFIGKSGHKWEHGKCTICGTINEKEGHSNKYKFKLNKDNNDLVDIYCSDCNQFLETKSYSKLVDRYEEEIKNANDAGCDAPIAESSLEKLMKLKK